MLRYFNGCDAFRYKVGELEMALTVREKAAYALGAVGKDIVYSLASGYVLYYYQDMDVSEIGTVLGIAQSSVSNRLKKGREMLRKALERRIYHG